MSCRPKMKAVYFSLRVVVNDANFSRFVPRQGNAEVKTRKRRRVLKSRTFVDDEGCIGTKSRQMIEHFREEHTAYWKDLYLY